MKKRAVSVELKFARRRNWLLYRLSGALSHLHSQIEAMESENSIELLVTLDEYEKLCQAYEDLERVIAQWKASWPEAKSSYIQRRNYVKFSRKAA